MDSNKDNLITEADTAWSSLLLWQDANGDGISAPSELKSLAEHQIQSLSTQYTTSTFNGNGSTLVQYSKLGVTKTDGSKIDLGGFQLRSDSTNATDPLQFKNLSETIEALPELAAIGTLHSLRVAMSSGMSQLDQLVNQLAPTQVQLNVDTAYGGWLAKDFSEKGNLTDTSTASVMNTLKQGSWLEAGLQSTITPQDNNPVKLL